MCDADDFGNREDRADFCGPRIDPILRIKRVNDDVNWCDEMRRRGDMWAWKVMWQAEIEAAGGYPHPTDPEVRATAAWDLFIDAMREHGFCKTLKREDERWL